MAATRLDNNTLPLVEKDGLGGHEPYVRIAAGVTIDPGDIEIGAVEIKNDSTDDRAKVLNAAPAADAFGLVTRALIGNGNDANAGATTDAAVVTDVNGTLSAKLRGLIKILADVWSDAANALGIHGNVAHDAVDTGNPVKSGGKANTLASPPASVAAGDRVDAYHDPEGRYVTAAEPINSGLAASRPNSQVVAVTTSGAYANGDVVGGIITLPTVNYASGRRVVLRSMQLNDRGNAKPPLNIYFFKVTPAGGTYTDNAALVWDAADSARKVGQTFVVAGDYISDASQASANIGPDEKLAVTGTSLFMLMIVQAAKTINNGDLTLQLEFDQE